MECSRNLPAQFFSSADHIVILGDGTVKEQGQWDDIREKAAAIEKFIPSSGAGASATSTPSATTKLTPQLRARDEAEADLARKTGDIALYGPYPLPLPLTKLSRRDKSWVE